MFKSRGKDKIKLSFEIVAERAFNLEKSLNGSTIYVAWRRGSKNNSGITKRVLVNKNEAIWRETFTVTTKLYRDSREQFEEKRLSI